jgi:hypothetical protein
MTNKDLWRRKVVLWGTNPSILWIFFDWDHGERVMDVDMAELQESGWTMEFKGPVGADRDVRQAMIWISRSFGCLPERALS